MSRKIGVEESQIAEWESGLSVPDSDTLIRLAAILKCSVDYLLGSDKDEYANDIIVMDEKLKQIHGINDSEANKKYAEYQLYKQFISKYPSDNDNIVLCCLALRDYLKIALNEVSPILNGGELDEYIEYGRSLLMQVIHKDQILENLINARIILIDFYIMKKDWRKAEVIAKELPTVYGIQEDQLNRIENSK